MRHKNIYVALGAACVMAACTSMNTTQVQQQVQLACGVDSGLRPTITALEPFMTVDEVTAITVARVAIDQVCQAPATATPTQTQISAMTASVNTLGQIVANVNARKDGKPVPFPNVQLPVNELPGQTPATVTPASPAK